MSIIKIKRTIDTAISGANLQFGELAFKDDSKELFIGSASGDAILIGSSAASANSADVTLATNSGLEGISSGDQSGLALGTPTTLSPSSTNTISGNTHSHAVTGFLSSSLSGAANGLASLDSDGKIPTTQIPNTLFGKLVYKGTYDIVAEQQYPSTPVTGDYYVSTSISGTYDGKTWTAGDLLIYNGSTWDQVQGGNSDVISVAGKTGVVTLAVGDVSGAAPLESPLFTGTISGDYAFFTNSVTASSFEGNIDGGSF